METDRPSGRRALWVGLALGVILIAAAIRLTGLTHPGRMYFDEV